MFRLLALLPLALLCCQSKKTVGTGTIERLDPALNAIIQEGARVEVLAEGFEWSEGPLWHQSDRALLFSDVPKNTAYKWTEAKGLETYLTPSGYTGTADRSGELGSNGLALHDGQLVLCQHGDRRVAVMEAPLAAPKPVFRSLANQFRGKRFNSPNDLVFDSKGNLYFTDPPYGLEKNMDDSSKELSFQGVYKADTSGAVTLLVDSITRPNGLAFTPDGTQLIVANSDSLNARWYIYEVYPDGSLANGRTFYDASAARKREQGNPDGLKIDKKGNVFATGPGGIWIFNKDARLLGKIRWATKVSNCAFSADEKLLFITADNYVLRVRLRS